MKKLSLLALLTLSALALVACGEDDEEAPAASCGDQPTETWCKDADGDGHGDAATAQETCAPPTSYVTVCDDCDDSRAEAYPGAPELCNGQDDTCDGQADEGLGVGDTCATGVGACRAEGAFACGPTGQVICTAEAGAPGLEVCDGLDNDCNGTVDDAETACACEDGQTVACGSDIGACTTGTQTCEGGQLGACVGAVEAAEEVCDGIDNDCNGQIDDLVDPGCGCVNGEVIPCMPSPEVFALSVEVRAPGGGAQATFIQPVNRAMFDGRRITNDNAIENEGIARLMTSGGNLFIGERTAPTIHKYEVGQDLSLTELDTISFAASGAPRIDIGQVWVNPSKAYFLWGGTLTGVYWNPDTMEIQESFDLTSAQREGFEGLMLLQGVFLFEHAVQGNRAFVSTLHSSGSNGLYYPRMAVTVFDTDTDEVLKVIEDDRCYGASTMLKADNGDIYVSSYSYAGAIYKAGTYAYKPTCILRIKAGEDEFDPDFFVSFPDVLEGRECTRWYPVNERYSYAFAIPVENLANAEQPHNTDGEIWLVDLQERRGEKVEELPTTTAFLSLGYPDSHDSLVLGVTTVPGQLDRSTVYRLVPEEDSVTPIFEVDGLFRGFYPIR